MKALFSEIPELNEITRIEKITAGWSFDEKYYIEQANGDKFVLRLTPADKLESKQKEYEWIFHSKKPTVTEKEPHLHA